ncbi:MAG: hypothetical protein ACRDOK_23740 [Streptosporangiaceae bacterium]
MTAPDYEALEARVADLERTRYRDREEALPQQIAAVSFGVSRMHAEMSETLPEHGEQLAAIRLEQERQRDMFGSLGRGLPRGPSNGPAGGEDDH